MFDNHSLRGTFQKSRTLPSCWCLLATCKRNAKRSYNQDKATQNLLYWWVWTRHNHNGSLPQNQRQYGLLFFMFYMLADDNDQNFRRCEWPLGKKSLFPLTRWSRSLDIGIHTSQYQIAPKQEGLTVPLPYRQNRQAPPRWANDGYDMGHLQRAALQAPRSQQIESCYQSATRCRCITSRMHLKSHCLFFVFQNRLQGIDQPKWWPKSLLRR